MNIVARTLLPLATLTFVLGACASSPDETNATSHPNETSSDGGATAAAETDGDGDAGAASEPDGGAVRKKDGGASAVQTDGGTTADTDAGSLGSIKPGFEFMAGAYRFYDPMAALRRNQTVGGGGSGRDGQSYNFPSSYQIDNSILLALNLMTTPGSYPPVGDYACVAYSNSDAIPNGEASFSFYDSPNRESFKSRGGDCVYHVLTSAAGSAGATWRITGTITGTALDTFTSTTTPIAASFDLDFSN